MGFFRSLFIESVVCPDVLGSKLSAGARGGGGGQVGGHVWGLGGRSKAP